MPVVLRNHIRTWIEQLFRLQVALISRYWTGWFIAAWALSWALCFPWLILLGTIYSAVRAYDSSMARSTISVPFLGVLVLRSFVQDLLLPLWCAMLGNI